jgi:hypothetical protein
MCLRVRVFMNNVKATLSRRVTCPFQDCTVFRSIVSRVESGPGLDE